MINKPILYSTIKREPTAEEKAYIRLLTDVLIMELLPKKQQLVIIKEKKPIWTGKKFIIRKQKVNKVFTIFTSNIFPKPIKEIEYIPDIVHRSAKEIGIILPFMWFKKYGFSKSQKHRENKYLNLDLLR